MIEASTIDAIGKLSVEVVAILALGISLFMQAKASLTQAKETKSLTEAIHAFIEKGTFQSREMTEIIKEVKSIARQNTEILHEHHAFAQQLAKKIHT